MQEAMYVCREAWGLGQPDGVITQHFGEEREEDNVWAFPGPVNSKQQSTNVSGNKESTST